MQTDAGKTNRTIECLLMQHEVIKQAAGAIGKTRVGMQ
jgi:hypothetical protein